MASRKVNRCKLKCIIHHSGPAAGKLTPFSSKSWERFTDCANIWLKCNSSTSNDGKDIAKLADEHGFVNTTYTVEKCGHLGYHRSCYQRFTNKQHMDRALRPVPQHDPIETVINIDTCVICEPPRKVRLSSESNLQCPSSTTLPDSCIICKKTDRFVTIGHKRSRDNLIQAETITAGNLYEAAVQRADESILRHIREKDCAAIEVKYHRICYRDYTRFITKKTCDRSDEGLQFTKAYGLYCASIIEPCLIRDHDIMRMSNLLRLFKRYVQKHEKVNASDYRSDQLKRRLSSDYPQLIFHSPSRRNTCDIVYVDTLSADPMVSRLDDCEFESDFSPSGTAFYVDTLSADAMVSQMDDSEFELDFSPSDADSQNSASSPLEFINHHHNLQTLFESGVVVNAAIKAQQSMDCGWPPTSDDLNVHSCEAVVPVELYNMLAWMVGASDECTIADRVNVPHKTHLILLSICQDIVYMSSGGRNQTPKSLALGLAVRHLTGSGQLTQLLNKFGHCASPDVVRGLETNLAELQLLSVDVIPRGFQKGKLTILVWDNIDFAEETITGAGTTHHTNGIMIQNNTDDVTTGTGEITGIRIKKGKHTLKPPLPAIEPFHQKKKCGPQNIANTDLPMDIYKDVVKQAVMTDLAYIVVRATQNEGCTIPGWRGFNMNCKSSVPAKSSIHYMPAIEASPTEMSTVDKVLQRSLEIADNMELNTVILVFDHAMYAKAQQIRWSNDLYMDRIVVRLGEFHTCMSYLGVLGRRFKEAGLQDILIEAEVVAPGSINGVITGHHYNRSIRAHTLMYEALERLRLKTFFDSIPEEQVAEDFLPFTEEIVDAYYAKNMDEAVTSSQFSTLMDSYSSFISTQSQESDTFQFWSSYIDMVQLLLTFIRATRESNWSLHLASIRLMMPWFFAYDRMNYSRYLPAYWLEMMTLPSTHYDCYIEMAEQGNWTVQRQDRYPFSSIACDQAIEQTVNRDSKTRGGITGFTSNGGGVQRWILAQPQRSAITRQCETMAGVSPETRSCKDNDPTRIKKDEAAITLIMDTISSMINPFDSQHDELVCLSSGVVADSSVILDLKNAHAKGEEASVDYMKARLLSVSLDLKNAHAKGEEASVDYMKARLLSVSLDLKNAHAKGEEASVDYMKARLLSKKGVDMFAPIKDMKLKTFRDQQRQTSKAEEVAVLRSDGALFARLLVIAQARQIDLREILTYSLGSISLPLASMDGSLAKTSKSALLDLVEKNAEDCLVTSVPSNSAIILDAMAVLQSLQHIPDTFGELADNILDLVISTALRYKCGRVDFVADRYPDMCIKNAERARRTATSSGSQVTHIYSRSQKTPHQWKKFMSAGDNKEALTEFLFSCWKEGNYSKVQDLAIYVTKADQCHLIDVKDGKSTVSHVDDLDCDHKKADTRLLLHTLHASANHNAVVIRSLDTDVAVIALSLKSSIKAKIFFLTGVKNWTRIINLQTISASLTPRICKSLIGMHIFTGCDSTSAFYGKGKKKAFELTVASRDFTEAFTKLGEQFDLSESVFTVLERFVCELYGQSKFTSVNEARYQIVCMAKSSEMSLPPTQDALLQHCKRSNYQAAIHRRALQQYISPPSPTSHGWKVENDELLIYWMSKDPAPEAVLVTVHCRCKAGTCSTAKCSCHSIKLACTDFCECSRNCLNKNADNEGDQHSDDDDDYDSDDDDDDDDDDGDDEV